MRILGVVFVWSLLGGDRGDLFFGGFLGLFGIVMLWIRGWFILGLFRWSDLSACYIFGGELIYPMQ